MVGRILLALAILVAALPAAALAQQAELRQEIKQKRVIIHPAPSPETFAKDVEEATAVIEAEARREQFLQEATGRAFRRPDLDPAVTSGIQARGLQHALPR